MAGRGRGTQPRPDLNTQRWKRIRKQVLDRDAHECQIRGPGCTYEATQVDHIQPHAHGGDDNTDNLRAACRPCNSSLGGRGRGRLLTPQSPPFAPQHYLSPHAAPSTPTRGVWHVELPG